MELYHRSLEYVKKELKTDDVLGLSQQEAQRRLAEHGPNELPETPTQSWVGVFLSQFKSPLIYTLLAAAALIYFIGPDNRDAFIISVVLVFNAFIGTIQEGRTRNILRSLKRFITANCIVIREGKKKLVENKDLVVGDLILLQAGQRVPADARIIQANTLQLDEAVLTGESAAVFKDVDIVADEAPLAERTNMVFKGTYIIAGSGKALVVATGVDTAIGRIHKSIEEIQEDMPLKRELVRLTYWVLGIILVFCAILFVIGLASGKPWHELLVMLTALFICVVPEGLPVVLTLVLVTGVFRMAKQQVLVKHMQAVEGLGRTDVILLDKTGTLTRNELMVSKIFTDNALWSLTGTGYHDRGEIVRDGKAQIGKNNAQVRELGIASALLNSAEIQHDLANDLFTIKGDPTEASMYVFAKKIGLSRHELESEYKKLYEIPFDSHLKYHAGFFEHVATGKGISFIIGSPETLFTHAGQVSESMQKALEGLLFDGLRVVVVAKKEFALGQVPQNSVERLKFFQSLLVHDSQILGLMGIQDSIRPEVSTMVEQARQAGLKVIMVTGDHQKTALYVAKTVGIFCPGDRAIDGVELNYMEDEELIRNLNSITVYSRVSPEQKIRIIKMFHKLGKIVAMTGDGINDVPSLVAADLGIAMGRIGTEVTKQAADLVLLDDSFVSIIHGIELGRHIFYTLRRVILYFFATNFGEILIVLFAMIVGLPLPILAAQILWLNLVTDGFLDVALAMEAQETGLLTQNWLKKRLRLVDRNLLAKMLFMAIPMGIGSIWIFYSYYQVDIAKARTMTLLTMAMFQWFNAWNCRSERKSLFQIGLFANYWLILATSFVFLLQFFLLYMPFMQDIFKTVPLSASEWGLIVAVSSPILLLEEIRKFIVRRWFVKVH